MSRVVVTGRVPDAAIEKLRLEHEVDAWPALAADPSTRIHLYGKSVRPGRKLGHVTVCGDQVGQARREAEDAIARLRGH